MRVVEVICVGVVVVFGCGREIYEYYRFLARDVTPAADDAFRVPGDPARISSKNSVDVRGKERKDGEFAKMPAFCGVIGCANKRKKFLEKHFFRLPAVDKRYGGKREKITRERRGKWLANLSRADLTEAGKRHLLVCSDHFLSSKYIFISYLSHNIRIKSINKPRNTEKWHRTR